MTRSARVPPQPRPTSARKDSETDCCCAERSGRRDTEVHGAAKVQTVRRVEDPSQIGDVSPQPLRKSEAFTAQLRTLFEAPYSFIYLTSHEEDRTLATVRSIAASLNRPLVEWSLLNGFRPPLSSSDDEAAEPSFIDALRAINADSQNAIYLVLDAHPYLPDRAVVRELREMEGALSTFNKTLVFLSPVASCPSELARDITFLNVPLPDRTQLVDAFRVVFPREQWPHLDEERLVGGALGLTTRQAMRAFHRARIELRSAQDESFDLESAIISEKRRLLHTTEVLKYHDLAEGLADVGGLTELKRWLAARHDAFSDRARSFGLPAPRGLLMLGVQGCGKSLMAKAVARFWGLPLLRLDIGALFASDMSPDAALANAIETAEAMSPAVLWMDEIEKALDPEIGGPTTRLLGSLVTWLQEKDTPVFFVATANRVENLPPELLRKGRFDEIFFVDLPDVHERLEILQIHLRKRGRSPDAFPQLSELAEKTEHFTGSELEQLVVDGMYKAFSGGGELSHNDMVDAFKETIPLYRTYEDQIKALREWAHERTRRASHDVQLLDYFGK